MNEQEIIEKVWRDYTTYWYNKGVKDAVICMVIGAGIGFVGSMCGVIKEEYEERKKKKKQN